MRLPLNEKQVTIPSKSDASGTVTRPERTVHVAWATFSVDQLNVIDIHAKRAYLKEKGFLGDDLNRRLTGIFANPFGGTAADVLRMDEFKDVCVVSGGVYFSKGIPPMADAFIFFRPDTPEGRIIAEINEDYRSGGYLLFDREGRSSMIRKNDFTYLDHENQEQICRGPSREGDCTSIQGYRLIVQSNIILVNNGSEDDNDDQIFDKRSVLVANRDGTASLVSIDTPVTLAEFGDLLVTMGALYAINLDGGPSTQMAWRTESGIKKAAGWTEQESPQPMPTLLSVTCSPFLSP